MAKYKIIPSSRTIVRSPISIGHKAEKGVEAIEFDLTAWVETYGSGTLTVIMRRRGDAIPYPIALEIDENNKATWTLSNMDTAKAGMAYAQLNYIVGDEVVKKSDIYTFRVMDSLTGEGEPPEAYESWLEHLTHLAAEAMAEVLDIEGIVTDKTLTVDGGIADAKATGEALALKADKSTTYTKTEVDQMIEDVEVETDTTLEVSGAPADAAETGRQIGLLKADLGAINTATSEDVGKALKAKTVTNGKVTEWEFGEAGSGGSADEGLEARVEALENVEPFYLLDGVEWEIGTMSNGQNSDSTTRIRTVGYVSIPDGLTSIPFHLENGIAITIYSYTSEKRLIGGTDTSWQTAVDYNYPLATGAAYVRIVIRKGNSGTMTDTSDSAYLSVDLSKKFVKDFLAMQAALDGKYDKSETYSKSEVEDLTGYSEIDLLSGDVWEVGNINYNTGADASSTTEIRTKYIPLPTEYTWLSTTIVSGGQYRMFFYNTEKTRITDAVSNISTDWVNCGLYLHKVPEGAAYVRFALRSSTAVTDSYKLTAVGYSLVAKCNAETEQIIGEGVEFEYGVYYGADSITESQITEQTFTFTETGRTGKRALINLKAGEILRIYGTGLSTTRQLYKVFDASTGVMIDNLTASDVTKIQPYYLAYDVDTHIYVSVRIGYPYSARIIRQNTLSYELIKSKAGLSVIELNSPDEVVYSLKGLKRKHYQGRSPAVFAHFSDPHGDITAVKRVVDFVSDTKVSGYIDDTICSGDIVAGTLADSNPMDSVDGAENILCVVGNHDAIKSGGDDATAQETYEKIFTGKIDNWSVTQPEGGAASYLCYYYKDYSTYKLRVVFLDSYHGSAYITAQASWLSDVLAGAKTAGYAVMCVVHNYFSVNTVQWVDCGFTPAAKVIQDAFGDIPSALVSAVDTFISGGGEFVCWIGGHGHQDYVITSNSGTQLEIGISTASVARASGDEVRETGTKSQDCINIVSVDTYVKTVSILRLGCDRSRFGVGKKHLVINYVNRKVIWSD